MPQCGAGAKTKGGIVEQPDLEYLTKLCGGVVAFRPVIYHAGNYDWRWGRHNTVPIANIRNACSDLLREAGIWPNMLVMSLDLFDAFCANESVNAYRRGRPGPVYIFDILEEQVMIPHIKVDHEWEGEPYCYVVATASSR